MQVNPPLVSVVICSYNYEQYVTLAVRSALAQSHSRTEVIVVDDGSADRSWEFLQPWAQQVTLIQKPNGGQLSSYNTGFDAAQGEFIIFLDADDILDPDVVKRALAAFEPDVARVHFRLRLMDGEGVVSTRCIPRYLASGQVKDELVHQGHLFASAPGSGNMYRRSALLPLMPLPVSSDDRHGADFYTIYGSALQGRLVALAQPGGNYRLHSGPTQADSLVFGNASQGVNEVQKVKLRCNRFKRWIQERTGIVIKPELLDFGTEKQAYALSIFANPGYVGGFQRGLGLLPSVVRSICLKRNEAWWLRMGLIGWACAILWLPRPLGWPLARRVCNPSSR